MKLKHIPNILGFIRIGLCVAILVLFLIEPFSVASISVFIAAGITDLIDGPLARRIKDGKSKIGATLDSVADMIMVIVAAAVVVPAMEIALVHKIIFWTLLVFKIGSGVAGQIKHKEMVFLHTYGNKLLGLTLFTIPIFYFFFVHGADAVPLAFLIYWHFVMFLVLVITTEEYIINLTLDKPSRDIKWVFDVKRENAKTRAASAEKKETPAKEVKEKE